MSATNIVLWLAGVALIAIGYVRARAPWARYRALRDQQANIDRYDAWRGGLRAESDGQTGASIAMAEFRRQAQLAGVIVVVGVVLVFVGFLIR